MVNILVVGSGGREHALSWKLSQSNHVETVYTAPGNGGTENNIAIDVNDLDGLAEFAQKNNYALQEYYKPNAHQHLLCND